jgi:hypothetical protein
MERPPSASSAASSYPPPPTGPTAVPKVFGVLSIVFGSLGLLGNLMGSCNLFVGGMMSKLPVPPGQDGAVFAQSMEALSGIYRAIGLSSLAFVAMSAWLLALGIGQLGYKAWARQQSVLWAGVALGVLAVVVVYFIAFVGPAYQDLMQAIVAHAPDDKARKLAELPFGTLIGTAGATMMALFYAPYPTVMLALFTRPHVKAAMQA